ncbi:hypothetical protein [Lentimicrobium sp. S6]|uniref:hypothetical protein n=1 Tax=Lentimicrobium sp. S6 TaxID=2735872 RepID=UPI00155772BC|nr:hypothetical protein [Lentimicrobium sp. S6]NPD48103.1 hypothetical protein [Lentimicrobium sp. S6]
MEKANIEIERFKKKAMYYKKALNLCPDARILEVFNIISVLDGYVKDNELDKSSLCIVDLMSGDGYLTKYLHKAGFRNIHSFEACNEMSFNSENYNNSGIKLYSIPEILEIEKIICNLKPQIVISLASFHHLIIHDKQEPKKVNTIESLNLQEKVIDICMRNLDDNGLLLITDIYDNVESIEEYITSIPFWNTFDSSKLLYNTLNETEISTIKKSKNQSNFNSIIDEKFTKYSFRRNPSINWFRQIVDKQTSIGHSDFAINRSLIEYIKSNYIYRFSTFACPWVFDNKGHLKNFLLNKFGFSIDDNSIISDNEVLKEADAINGITDIQNNRVLFGWNLSMTILSKTETIYKKKTNKKRTVFILLLLLLILVINIVMNLSFKLYNKELIAITNSLSLLLLGYLLPEAFSFISKTIFNQK